MIRVKKIYRLEKNHDQRPEESAIWGKPLTLELQVQLVNPMTNMTKPTYL